MSRAREQDGFTLVELLVAASLMLVVMAAALTTLERYVFNNQQNQRLADDVETARNGMDLMVRDARNATAYQTTLNTTDASVLRAGPADFVFKSVDPNTAASTGNDYRVRTVRYCYSAGSSIVLRQVIAGAAVPSSACPDTAWRTTSTIPGVVNAGRDVFTYDAAAAAGVTQASVDLFIDATPNRAPVETPLHSGVFLRNANRAPTAGFTASASPNLHVRLNGSASLDPDGGTLTYTWKDGGTMIPQNGPVVDYVATTGGTHTFSLTVTDRGGLTATTTQTITVQP